ncbi:MAG: hypothetical protein IJI20_00055 [Firmicutes bacterium]|nr:hypothetical protein [Bacillota bacterium]
MAQAFYGIVVIAVTICNWAVHKALERPNAGNQTLLDSTRAYRRLLVPDIVIKVAALVLALTVSPPLMMYGVLIAAGCFQLSKALYFGKTKKVLW